MKNGSTVRIDQRWSSFDGRIGTIVARKDLPGEPGYVVDILPFGQMRFARVALVPVSS